jgi:hypothetical protein
MAEVLGQEKQAERSINRMLLATVFAIMLLLFGCYSLKADPLHRPIEWDLDSDGLVSHYEEAVAKYRSNPEYYDVIAIPQKYKPTIYGVIGWDETRFIDLMGWSYYPDEFEYFVIISPSQYSNKPSILGDAYTWPDLKYIGPKWLEEFKE